MHATEARHIVKYDLWGKRILDHNPLSCFFVFEDETPVGFINLGLTGNTVKDNKYGKEVIEFNVFFADSIFSNDSSTAIADASVALGDYIRKEILINTALL